MKSRRVVLTCLLTAAAIPARAAELHVATTGNDSHAGTVASPLRTIQRAADLARPGDIITVHAGVYRERVNPPCGGESDVRRIVYQAAPGETVEIRGSEVIKGWEKVRDDVWKVDLPDSFFGGFNPFVDRIRGDWFDPRGRTHHTGAVYLNGDWLTEAVTLDEVLMPGGVKPAWLTGSNAEYLLNVAWLRPRSERDTAERVAASRFAAQRGVQVAPCSEGGECLGFLEHGDWVRYDAVALGDRAEQLEFRAASASARGGDIQIRLDAPNGELLGTCTVNPTGDWQTWASFTAAITPIGGTRSLCLVFKDRKPTPTRDRGLNPRLWFAQHDAAHTTLWAQFPGVDPNAELVEINVRQSVFYPDRPGRNYLTVRGFTMRHAATPWAPPTAEQVGLLGTHWSKGWIIENNTISHSVCTGISLGKHGDSHDNTSSDTAEGYVATIERAHAFSPPWTKENIGHHVVRGNTISHCEQAGIVGSLGAAFSSVTGNTIHDIHVRRLFSGAEMAGIKFHGAIDTTIGHNHIYRCCQALWLDWMAQGTRVTANLFHDNEDRDLFLEVNHGPFLIDNNVFLSPVSLLDMSEGGAFVHNLFVGKLISAPELNRQTPFHPAHSTTVAGLARIEGGENRFYHNIFVGDGADATPTRSDVVDPKGEGGFGLWVYGFRPNPLQAGGNVYYFGAHPVPTEEKPVLLPGHDPATHLERKENGFFLRIDLAHEANSSTTGLVTGDRLGKARVPGAPFENSDGTPLKLDTDYFGTPRAAIHPSPGPFESAGEASLNLRVW